MNRGGNIVVGVDGSERARGVLENAAELAKLFDADLVLVRAITAPVEMPAEAFTLSPDRVLELLETRARASLEERAKELPQGLRVKSIVRSGAPWQVVCEVGREMDARLIVIGSHGYAGLDRILGTTAERVVDHADRSVLVVRETVRKKGTSE